jgi:uncharacterized protein YprB with RNaseH-like and TPR domain
MSYWAESQANMDLKEKLARLDRNASQKKEMDFQVQAQEEWVEEFQRELSAKIYSEGNSFIILKENYYPVFSNPAFNQFQSQGFLSANFLKMNGESGQTEINFRDCLFIDLETTGLSGGTGTYAFLVGIGHIELDHIVVRQYLLPDFQHEWLLLKLLENNLNSFSTLVSFNGKSFDIPLIRNRFILNRLETVLDELFHVDLLHISRRIWKKRIGACDLQTLENEILGQQRINDIPGMLIPQIYFEYIRKRYALLLRDIVNLALLMLEVAKFSENPVKCALHPDDLFSLSRYYYQQKYFTDALPLLTHLVQNHSEAMVGKEALFLLSMVHKKMGDYRTAGEYMQRLFITRRDNPDVLEELAKYYEHREKDYHAALQVVEAGIEHIELMKQLDGDSQLSHIEDSLHRREARLKRKLSKLA